MADGEESDDSLRRVISVDDNTDSSENEVESEDDEDGAWHTTPSKKVLTQRAVEAQKKESAVAPRTLVSVRRNLEADMTVGNDCTFLRTKAEAQMRIKELCEVQGKLKMTGTIPAEVRTCAAPLSCLRARLAGDYTLPEAPNPVAAANQPSAQGSVAPDTRIDCPTPNSQHLWCSRGP